MWKSDLDWAERPKNKEAGNLPSTVVKLEANIKNHINEKKQNNNNEKNIRRNRKWRKPNPLSTKQHKSSLKIAYIWKPTLSGFTTSQKNFLASLLGVFCDSKLATIPRDNCVLISWLRGNVAVHYILQSVDVWTLQPNISMQVLHTVLHTSVSHGTVKNNISNNQEILKLAIISFTVMTLNNVWFRGDAVRRN